MEKTHEEVLQELNDLREKYAALVNAANLSVIMLQGELPAQPECGEEK